MDAAFNFNSVLLALLNLLIGGVLVTVIRTRVPLKKIAADREANLLEERADEMKLMRTELAELKADLAVERHKNNNQRLMIYSLLHLFDMPAAKRKEALAAIREELAAIERAEAAEKGAIHADKIRGAGA